MRGSSQHISPHHIFTHAKSYQCLVLSNQFVSIQNLIPIHTLRNKHIYAHSDPLPHVYATKIIL